MSSVSEPNPLKLHIHVFFIPLATPWPSFLGDVTVMSLVIAYITMKQESVITEGGGSCHLSALYLHINIDSRGTPYRQQNPQKINDWSR